MLLSGLAGNALMPAKIWPMLFPTKIEDHEYECLVKKEFKKIKLSDIKTKYIVIIFYPLDFTFVCPTEILKFSDMHEEFRKLDTTVIYASADSKYSHLAWAQMRREDGGLGSVEWPIISDITHKLSSQFNLFNEASGTVMRGTVILNRSLEVLHISANIDPIGRSSTEILRLLKAIEHNATHGEVCFVDFEG